jgi:putative transposase
MRAPPPAQRVYPYWLRGVPITRVHQVWSTDITDIRRHGGSLSLVAVRDWCSRSGRSWALSMTLDVGCCLEALEPALEVGRPDMCKSAQGAQGTRLDVTRRLTAAGRQRSMDGRGRALDNVCGARRWRTVTYEEVSVKDDATPHEARPGRAPCFGRSNEWRQHQARGSQTPASVYCGSSV